MTARLLSGKRVVITGAARGLGKAMAEAVAEQGAHVVVTDILEEEGRETARELALAGGEARFVHMDLAEPDSIRAAIEAAAEALGGIDGLVNNGAIATGIGGKDMHEIDIDVWDRVMQVNVRGAWLTTCAARPHLVESGAGRVVNIASDTALWGAPKLMHYVASKGAIIAMTRSMARELGEHDIAVNAIAPGLTIVKATEHVPKERHELYVRGRAIRREQFPRDITGAVVFLLSDAAAFITGQLLPVNGGFTM